MAGLTIKKAIAGATGYVRGSMAPATSLSEARHEICRNCPSRMYDAQHDRCRVCGCVMSKKTKLNDHHCDLGHW